MKCPTCARDVSDPLGDEAKYIESLRARADDAKASADHRARVIGDLTRKLEAANKLILNLKTDIGLLRAQLRILEQL